MLTYIGGYQFFYSVYQAGLKAEMRSYLQKNNVSKFGIHLKVTSQKGQIIDSKFQWEEKGEEFRYDHELYDIVSIENFDGYSIICCLKDNSENLLEKQLEEIRKTEKKTFPNSSRHQLKFFSVFCTCQEKTSYYLLVQTDIKRPILKSAILNSISEIVSPPPQC